MVFKPNYAIFRLNNMEALPKRRVRKKKELYVSALFVSCFGTVLVLKCPSPPLHNFLDMHNNPPHNHIAWSLREHRHKTSVLLLASFASSHTVWVHIVKNDWATGYVPILGQSLKIGICHYDTGGIKRSLCIKICIILRCAYTSCQSFLNKHHTQPFSSWHRQPTATSDKTVLRSSATAATTQNKLRVI